MDRPLAWHVPGIDLAAERPFSLGATAIDPASRDASFPGGTERLRPQSLKVLIALARRKGEVVSRNDLVDLCWDGRVIGEDVINHSISLLRTFAERAGGFSIETVPKAGYRLVETATPSRSLSWRFVLGAWQCSWQLWERCCSGGWIANRAHPRPASQSCPSINRQRSAS